jgi:hypothetical protein
MPRARVINKLPLPFRERGKQCRTTIAAPTHVPLEMPIITDFDCFPERPFDCVGLLEVRVALMLLNDTEN